MGQQKLKALAPEAEILEYVNDLKSLTQGSGYFNKIGRASCRERV